MTTALERVTVSREVHSVRASRAAAKAFSEPPFWAMDSLRSGFQSSLPDRERLEHDFEGYARGGGKSSAVVFGAFYARLRHYAQATFRWENLSSRELSAAGEGDLAILDRPWPTGTTADLLAWMEVDATFAGNSYWTFTDDRGRFGRQARGPSRRLSRLRPDWVWIIIGSNSDDPFALDARPVAIVYWPRVAGGATAFGASSEQVTLLPSEVAHYAPVPDPEARFRGMSWITPVLREVAADRAATQHKLRFFERGASLQTIVALDKEVGVDAFDEFVARFKAEHEGTDNAFRTLFVGGGADVTTTSANLQELDYKAVQGGGETRILMDAGVHPVVAAASEGMQGSSLNAGNYRSAMRSFADGTLTHLWTVTTASLQNLVTPPSDTRLWIDKARLPFLQDDARDIAEIQQMVANALRAMTDAGWEPDAAVQYLRSNDIGKLLGRHTGLFSVQLQPPGTAAPPPPSPNGTNGMASRSGEALVKELLAFTRGEP